MRKFLIICMSGLFVSAINPPGNESFADAASGGVTINWVVLVKIGCISAPLSLALLFPISLDLILFVLRLMLPLILLASYGILTGVWSAAPGYSLSRSISQLLLFVSVAVLIAGYWQSYRRDIRQVILRDIALALTIIILPFAVLGALGVDAVWRAVFPGGATVYRLGGDILPPNILGAATAIHVILLWSLWLRRGVSRLVRTWAVVLLVSDLYVLVYSGSRGATISMVAAVGVGVLIQVVSSPLDRMARVRAAILCLAGGVVVFVLVAAGDVIERALGVSVDLVSRDGDSAELTTLTGRTELWGMLLDAPPIALLIGNGFGTLGPNGSVSVWTISTYHAHNGYLQILAGCGVIGVGLLVWFLGRLVRALRSAHTSVASRNDDDVNRTCLIVILVILISNCVESSIGTQIVPQTCVLLVVGVALLYDFRPNRAPLTTPQYLRHAPTGWKPGGGAGCGAESTSATP
jgi:O-antigen ligase